MDNYLEAFDGTSIRYRVTRVENPRAVLVINHGFAEHVGRYDHVAEYFSKEGGLTVYRYDLRGHGKTEGRKGHIDSYKTFIDDSHSMVELARRENPKKDIFMLGHSMGGLVTCMYGLSYPNSLKGQIFSGAAVNSLPKAKGLNKGLLKLLGTITPRLPMRNVVEDDICTVEEVVRRYKSDPEVLKKADFKFLKEFLVEAPKFVRKNIGSYNYPCLICHGKEDKIVPVDISYYLYDNISSRDKELRVYKGLYHEILNEEEKYQVMEDMLNWLNKRIDD